MPSCLNEGPEKSLSTETCLDLELRNKKPDNLPVFCRQVVEDGFYEVVNTHSKVINHVTLDINPSRQ